MTNKLQCAAIVLCLLSYAMAETPSIGTVNAGGDIRVDSYAIRGNATLFDGSVIETSQASADLRLRQGLRVTMSTDSSGTLFRDHLLLARGTAEISAPNGFRLEANGLQITSNLPNTRGVVSMVNNKKLQVSALAGQLDVSNEHGVLLAQIHPGKAISFAAIPMGKGMDDQGSNSFAAIGLVTYENGHYYLETDTGVRYELTCKDVKKYKGMKVGILGNIQQPAAPERREAPVCVTWIGVNSPYGPYAGGIGTKESLLIVGGVAAAIAGVLIGINVSSGPSTPASR